MSQTLFVSRGNEGFWAFDVAAGVFLKHLIDRAEHWVGCHDLPWLESCIARWRVIAVVPDCGLDLDPVWSVEQRTIIQSLIQEACQHLESLGAISADEAASWKILKGQGIHARGAAQIRTAPVVELGRAIGALLDGSLPCAPPGTWWLYGHENGRSTIRKHPC